MNRYVNIYIDTPLYKGITIIFLLKIKLRQLKLKPKGFFGCYTCYNLLHIMDN